MGVRPAWRGSRKAGKKRKLVTEVERVTSLQLLGKARLNSGEGTVEFLPNKRFQLLAYLAWQGDWVTRDKLVFLFWPDEPNHTARQNLRQLLKHIRNFTWLEKLESDEHRLRWLVKTDLAVFRKALEKGDLEQALRLCQGEFCADLENGDAGEFANWLESERQTLDRVRIDAALKLVTELESREDFARAASVFERHYQDEPVAEEHLRRYLANLARSGQKDKARDVFEHYKNRLEREFKGKPEKETLELIEKIRRGEVTTNASTVKTARPPVTATRKTEVRHNLPAQSTLFVGRESERQKLSKVLAGPNCRLLSVVAPGGMGKTRLAIEVAKTQPESFEEVCFISFAAVASADLMVYTVAEALELSFFGPRPPKEQLLEYLKNKNMLLVLDNLEHLLSGVDLIDDILKTSPGIKILATSREILNLQAEHVFDLSGLTVPEHANVEAQKFDALQLFAERARHNRLDFVLEQHLKLVTRICQRVAGMPLAIELAASWLRLLSTEEIASEIEKSIDVFSSLSRDVPERHRNMRKVFEASWQRLSDEEQTALRKLSVFQGGFEREAASAVAELELPVLLSLVNKSFLWRDEAGRFSQHPLILQYIQDKAKDSPGEKKQVEEKHGLYYLELVMMLKKDLRTLKEKQTRETLDKEIPNIRAAWNWVVREKRVQEILRYNQSLSNFLEFGHDYEGVEMFRQVVGALDEANPEHRAALGYALIQQAWHDLANNNQEITQRGLAFLEPLNEFQGIILGRINLGIFQYRLGEFLGARENLTVALALAKRYNDPLEIGGILNQLSMTEKELGNFSEVLALMNSRLEELRELGDLVHVAWGLRLLGAYLIDNDQLDEGEKFLREAWKLGRESNYAGHHLTALARVAYKRGNFREAGDLAEQAYEQASRIHDQISKAVNLALQGRVKLAQQLFDEAAHLLLESLRLGWTIAQPLRVSHSLVCLAELGMAKADIKQGVALLHFLTAYPVIEKRDRDEALKLLEKAKAHLLPQEFVQAQEESKSLTLKGIVTGILEQSPE